MSKTALYEIYLEPATRETSNKRVDVTPRVSYQILPHPPPRYMHNVPHRVVSHSGDYGDIFSLYFDNLYKRITHD